MIDIKSVGYALLSLRALLMVCLAYYPCYSVCFYALNTPRLQLLGETALMKTAQVHLRRSVTCRTCVYI